MEMEGEMDGGWSFSLQNSKSYPSHHPVQWKRNHSLVKVASKILSASPHLGLRLIFHWLL